MNRINLNPNQGSKWLPTVYIIISLVLMFLPLQQTVNSVRAVLAYLFIPQLRLAHQTKEYFKDINEGTQTLLNVAYENFELKEKLKDLEIEVLEIPILRQENERLRQALNLKKATKINGVWTKVAYKEPSKMSSLIIDKGQEDGITLRSPALALTADGAPALLGMVVEVSQNTSKILLLPDEDFNAYVYLANTKTEALLKGHGLRNVTLKYLPLEEDLLVNTPVFTSSSSALFPEGLLVGYLLNDGSEGLTGASTYKEPALKPALDFDTVKEVFVLSYRGENNV
ncbi:MAG: rod shape-determining protein MreC [Elusimicrobiaceae bacterium]|nr:rod shape-determining protein MreC [Elusimicrobiaceae bacterium]